MTSTSPGTPLPPVIRILLRRPATSLAAVVMLSLGIGASTAVFSLMAPVLLQPLGSVPAEQLAQASRTTEGGNGDGAGFTLDNGLSLEEIRAHRTPGTQVTAIANAEPGRFIVRSEGRDARYLNGLRITSGYFTVMDLSPWLGRGFTQAEDVAAEPVVIISHALWADLHSGRKPDLGQVLLVDGEPCTVVGVMPRHFAGHEVGRRTDLWLPQGLRMKSPSGETTGTVFASSDPTLVRLAPGVSPAQAESTFRAIGTGFQEWARLPGTRLGPVVLRPFAANRAAKLEQVLPAPWLLLSAAGTLLLLACANVANLQLALLVSRRQEFATRLSLGAKGTTLIRGVLAENLVLCAVAGGIGLLLAKPIMAGLQAIRSVTVYEVPLHATISVEAALFALVLTFLSAICVGLGPAIQASRIPVAQVLKDTAGQVTRNTHVQDGLVVAQVALALVLVTGGTLVASGLNRARGTDLGFRPAGVAALRIEFPESTATARRAEVILGLSGRLSGLPTVHGVSWAEDIPMERESVTVTSIHGRPCRLLRAGPGYFSLLGLKLVRGRDFSSADLGGTGRILNQALAERLWPGKDPVGRGLPGGGTVIGVVADHGTNAAKNIHEPVLFAPLQAGGGHRTAACLLFRTEAKPQELFPAIRQILRNTDPDLPLLRLTTLEAHLDGLHHDLKVASWLLGFCGFVALSLSAMGIQGLLTFRINLQAREMGLRMALGAQRVRIVGEVAGRGMRSVLWGLALGGLGSFWAAQAFHHLFPAVEALHVGTFLPALMVILVTSLAACLLPALRAASLDPAEAMRHDGS